MIFEVVISASCIVVAIGMVMLIHQHAELAKNIADVRKVMGTATDRIETANSTANATQLKLCEILNEMKDKQRPEDGQLVAYDYLGEINFGRYHAGKDAVDYEMSGETYPLNFRDVGRWKVVVP